MVLPAAQLGGSCWPKVSYCQSPPVSWTPCLLTRGVDVGTVDNSHSGLDLEVGSHFLGLLIPSCTLFPIGLHLRSSYLEAGPARIMIQRKLGSRSFGAWNVRNQAGVPGTRGGPGMPAGPWPQNAMIEKNVTTKNTFAHRKLFSLFLLGLGAILGHGLLGLTQGREKKRVIWLERVNGGNI